MDLTLLLTCFYWTSITLNGILKKSLHSIALRKENNMHIVKVKTKKQMQAFVMLPKSLHGHSRCYAPPIWMDERKAYFGKNNPILSML